MQNRNEEKSTTQKVYEGLQVASLVGALFAIGLQKYKDTDLSPVADANSNKPVATSTDHRLPLAALSLAGASLSFKAAAGLSEKS